MKFYNYLFTLTTFFTLFTLFALPSCSVTKQISRQANTILLNDTAIRQGHIGISIYEPATGKYWYNYDAEKYFVPASNTKLFTLYAGMKYLGDSLVGIKVFEYADAIFLHPAGDPTFLHPNFLKQPVLDFLSAAKKRLWAVDAGFKTTAFGKGWAWDDYNESYMNERSLLPVFGNVIVFNGTKDNLNYFPKGAVNFSQDSIHSKNGSKDYISKVNRSIHDNSFILNIDGKEKKNIVVPFITSASLAFKILSDTLHKQITGTNDVAPEFKEVPKKYSIHSQPTDSLFKPMMHNSDNFFAEQTLLMASNEHLGYMSDEDIIDSLLKSDLTDAPQKPKWVDGSGLSRYNLFTPQDFVYILNKIKNEFGWARIKNILPTGGTGTLSSYYKKDSSFIYAKTGTLSNNCALSGYLITKKNKLLIFSVLANNYQTAATPVRRAVEKFIESIREKY